MIRNEYFMTINIFILKGDLNGKIVVVRFFFCRVYICWAPCGGSNGCVFDNLDRLSHLTAKSKSNLINKDYLGTLDNCGFCCDGEHTTNLPAAAANSAIDCR